SRPCPAGGRAGRWRSSSRRRRPRTRRWPGRARGGGASWAYPLAPGSAGPAHRFRGDQARVDLGGVREGPPGGRGETVADLDWAVKDLPPIPGPRATYLKITSIPRASPIVLCPTVPGTTPGSPPLPGEEAHFGSRIPGHRPIEPRMLVATPTIGRSC